MEMGWSESISISGFRNGSAFTFQNPFHLLQMIQIMPGDHPHDVVDALITTFLMNAVVVPQLSRD